MKSIKKILCFAVLIGIIMCHPVYAEGQIKVMEVNDGGDNPIVYVKGVEGTIGEVSALVGSTEALKIDHAAVGDGGVNIKTLILFDNSLSIPEKRRDEIKNLVSELVAGRSNNEQFAIATFGESIEMLSDYTDDYTQLKGMIDNMQFQDRETYLTDVLYDLISNPEFSECDNDYKRIFVITDGVDNKEIGYTTEELASLLKSESVPIYTVGVYNNKQSNSNELEKLFAISRQTNADSFLLDSVDNPTDILNSLAQDRNIIRFDIQVSPEIKDGSEKTITLNIDGQNVQIDNVRMPQRKVTKVSENNIDTKHTPVNDDTKDEKEPDPVPEEKKLNPLFIIIPIIVVILLLTGAIILIVRIIKKKKEEEKFVEIPTDPPEAVKKTEILDKPGFGPDRPRNTFILNEGMEHTYMVSLVDVSNPAHSFTKPIADKIVIGRPHDENEKFDINITYERSVSGPHCEISRQGNQFYIKDLNSGNGTIVNGNRISSKVEIASGSIIKLGRVELKVEFS